MMVDIKKRFTKKNNVKCQTDHNRPKQIRVYALVKRTVLHDCFYSTQTQSMKFMDGNVPNKDSLKPNKSFESFASWIYLAAISSRCIKSNAGPQ